VRYTLYALGLAGAYVAAAKLGIELSVSRGVITPVWAPTGIAIAGLFLLGRRLWPAVALGAFVANAISGASLLESAGISVGNTLEAVVAASLLLHYDVRPALERIRDVVGLIVLAACVSPMIAATSGAAVVTLSGDSHDYASSWLLWWIGDAMGALTVTPLLLVWSTRPWRQFPGLARRVEAAAIFGVLAAVSALVFDVGYWRYPQAVFPLLILATLRFRQPGAVTSSFLVTAIAIGGASAGDLPLGSHTPTQVVEIVEGLLAGVIASLYLLGAVLSERELALSGLAEAQRVARIGSWEWDIGRDRVTWSRELYELYGLDHSTPIDYESYLGSIHPADADQVRATVQASRETGEPFETEHRVRLRDGQVRWLHGRGRVIADDAGRPLRMVGTSQDITERKRVDELRDTILAAVSHELRTPLTSIIGFALTLRELGTSVSPELRDEIIGHLTVEAHRLERLLTDLLDLDRLRSGASGATFRRANLGRLVAEVAAAHESDGQTVSIDVEPVEAEVDGPKVERLVDNLVANAFRHTPPGSEVSVSVRQYDGGALIRVDDSGPGVREHERETIFEIFRRGDAGMASGRGTGVGLALVAQFAALHGGRAWVEDNPGGGASFRVFLPSSRPS
jgi:PAS domain S-box-containing protein